MLAVPRCPGALVPNISGSMGSDCGPLEGAHGDGSPFALWRGRALRRRIRTRCSAPAEDLEACYKAQGEAAISVCTAAITSKKHQGAGLATAHIVRGNAYFKGDYN